MPQLIQLEGKHDFPGNPDFQTLNMRFPGYFERKKMLLVPENKCETSSKVFILTEHRENNLKINVYFFVFQLLDTGPSYCTKSTLCTGIIHYPGLSKQTGRSWGLDKVGIVPNKHLLHPVICQVIPMSEFFHDMI